LAGLVFLLCESQSARADFLPNNFWTNSTFEAGSNLDQTDGDVSNWNRGGNDPTICQVITNNSVSSGHSLAVIDTNAGDLYGEWYSDVLLDGHVSGGDTLDIQWYEMYNLDGPEMRLTVLFFGASDPNNPLTQTHFVTSGSSNPGWVSTIADSAFTKRSGSLPVPLGAVKMRCSLVSGGSGTLTGVMVIDDLSVARSPAPNLLSGNFWVNPSFELGSNLDQTNGAPSNWNRGGSDATICQVLTNNFASSSHVLALVDPSSPVAFGEWYSDVLLSGNASPGDVVNLQWFEMFNIADGEMRLTVRFLDASDNGPDNHFVVSGQSAGWQGSIENSSFVRRTQSLTVPAGAVKMRCALVSGGPEATTGVYLIDDLSVARAPRAALLPGNFWVNSTFETGAGLDQTNGAPANWNRGGSDATICQVTTNNYTSSSHALALVDPSTPTAYGEWYSDVSLSGNASPGDAVNIQWFELFNIADGEMRLTVRFLDASDNGPDNHFVVSGQSAGWQGSTATSSFVKRNQTLTIPAGAVKMRVALVSGGPEATTGVFLIDDLSVSLVPPTVLAGNFFPNPTFELGDLLDNPASALPAGIWSRGGSDGTIDQVSTSNSVSATHSLALVDNNEGGYGEWYGFLPLSGVVTGDALDLQWFQLYDTTNGGMRLSFAFTDAANNQVGSGTDFNASGQSPGWLGSLAASPFERRNERLVVPDGGAKLRVNFASGGSGSVVGTMLIDDLSVRIGKLAVTGLTPQAGGFDLTWSSVPGKSYTVQFAAALGSTTVWTPLITGLVSGDLTTTYSDTAIHAGNGGFYRVIQE
jgi:hypothetical protein